MTSTDNPNHTGGTGDRGSSNGTAYATTSSVTGLAREIEGLRADLTEIRTLKARLDELADLVAQLATAVATATPAGGVGVASWLDLPTDPPDTAAAVLTELIAWMEVVYLRYSDAAQGLPDCWLWHPDVVEELLWLMHAWLAAYHDDTAPVSLAADWHDRYRPGVVKRINTTAGRCSLEAHQPRDNQPDDGGQPVVPLAEAMAPIAEWWATHRTNPAPHPDPDHLATAAARRRPGTRR
ncbi:MAG: hypothetical protein DLM61_18100 [Pseudonocardiales bacterium]|nr:MAG: hypothetical protein DLM61_18100 [Pseudonocardiales bacterium]